MRRSQLKTKYNITKQEADRKKKKKKRKKEVKSVCKHRWKAVKQHVVNKCQFGKMGQHKLPENIKAVYF